MTTQMWRRSHRADRPSRLIADRHYNRQKVGTTQFVPPGRCLVLRSDDDLSLWVTVWPKFAQHDWVGAWMNTCFRREGGEHQASTMIRAAVAATLSLWPDPPDQGMVTFVDRSKVRSKRNPGYCYLKAGFTHVGFTRKGLWVLQMLPEEMPDPLAALVPHGQLDLATQTDPR